MKPSSQSSDLRAAEIRRLVSRAQEGDSEAFAKIYEIYLSPLYRFIWFRVRKKEEAEDLTQNVFVRAFSSLNQFEDKGLPVSVWFYTIARNLVIDYWKKKREVLVEEPGVFFEEVVDERSDASAPARQNFDSEVLKRAIAQLSDDQQEVIILYCLEEKTYSEVAEILGKSQEAVRALKHRALKVLREILKKYGYETS